MSPIATIGETEPMQSNANTEDFQGWLESITVPVSVRGGHLTGSAEPGMGPTTISIATEGVRERGAGTGPSHYLSRAGASGGFAVRAS